MFDVPGGNFIRDNWLWPCLGRVWCKSQDPYRQLSIFCTVGRRYASLAHWRKRKTPNNVGKQRFSWHSCCISKSVQSNSFFHTPTLIFRVPKPFSIALAPYFYLLGMPAKRFCARELLPFLLLCHMFSKLEIKLNLYFKIYYDYYKNIISVCVDFYETHIDISFVFQYHTDEPQEKGSSNTCTGA